MDGTVLLMVDLQNSYLPECDEMRTALGWPPIWNIGPVLDACADLADEARSQGIPVIYSRAAPSCAGPLGRTPQFARAMAKRAERIPVFSAEQEEWQRQIIDRVAPRPGDIVLDKTSPSFFERTELEPLLRNLRANRLIVAGLQTNVCIESTVRSGISRNFEVAVPEDAVSTDGPDLHHASLNSMRVLYVEVAPWRELVAPGAPWDRAATTPNYGRNPEYWAEADDIGEQGTG